MNYDSIFIIVYWFTKMIHNKPMQMIDAPGLAEVLIDLIVRHSPPRPPQLDYTSRLSCHLKVLVFFVLLPRRQATTIQSLSLTGFGRCYAISWCRYWLMHPGSPTRLSEIEAQSSPSSGARDTTFRLGYGYTPLSLTAVIIHASFMRTSNKNLMTAYHKNLPHGLDIANLFPPDFVRLRAWI